MWLFIHAGNKVNPCQIGIDVAEGLFSRKPKFQIRQPAIVTWTIFDTLFHGRSRENGLTNERRRYILYRFPTLAETVFALHEYFSEILIKIHISIQEMGFKISSGKWRPFYLVGNRGRTVVHSINKEELPSLKWALLQTNRINATHLLWLIFVKNAFCLGLNILSR